MPVTTELAMTALVNDLEAAFHESIGMIDKIEHTKAEEAIITVKGERFLVTLQPID